jgi:hypothetical protein
MKPDMYIMPSEAMSMVYLINNFNQYFQQCGLSNCIVFLTSLRIHTKVFFLLAVSDTKVTVKEK